MFILNVITRLNLNLDFFEKDNIYYTLKVSLNGVQIEFRDTMKIIPLSLSDTAKAFCPQYSKIEYDHNRSIEQYINNPVYIKQLVDYCIHDCIILFNAFENFIKLFEKVFGFTPINKITIASLSFYIFRWRYLNCEIEILSPRDDAFVRQAFKGGYVDVFIPKSIKKIFIYDVNSLYPFIMKEFVHPGKKLARRMIKPEDNFNIENFFGFVLVKVTSPEYMHKPFLTVHDEERGLISPLGCWSGVYFSEEIKYALTLGYTFEYIEAMEFDKVKPFVEFIPYIYKKRLESKTNPGLNLIYKLLMNSLYGRFGMKYENKSSVIGPEKLIHQAFLTKSNVTYRKINNMYLISYVNKAADVDILNALLEMKKINITKYNSLLNKKDFGRKNTPQIAASITAYARIHMHKLFMKAEGEIFYTDTDSIHTSCTYPPEYVSSTELGKLKLENIASEAIYLSPKMYFQKLLDGSHIYKAKGLTKQNIDAHQYEVLYKSPSFVSEFVHNFMRDFNTFSVHKKIVSFTHTGDFLKRQKVFNTDGQWIATEPLKINK